MAVLAASSLCVAACVQGCVEDRTMRHAGVDGSAPSMGDASRDGGMALGADGGGDADAGAPSFRDVFEAVLLSERCVYPCHDSSARGDLSMSSTEWSGGAPRADRAARLEAYAALVEMPASTGPDSQCAGWTRVVPGDPAASLLFVKIAGLETDVCGGRMPAGAAPPVPAARVELVRAWIAAGAAFE